MGARMPQFSVTIETIQIEYFQDGRVDRPLLDGEQRALGSAMSSCLFQDAPPEYLVCLLSPDIFTEHRFLRLLQLLLARRK